MIALAVLVSVALYFGTPAPPPVDAPTLFRNQCLSCHSLGGKGGGQAPPLDGVGTKYEKLKGSKAAAKAYFINHLKDPKTYPGSDPDRYSTEMPSFKMLTGAELNALADFLLEKS